MSFLTKLPSLFAGSITHNLQVAPGGLFNICVRTVIRDHFPRPSEHKRIKTHGYWARMKTRSGQRILMRKMIRGKHVYSH